MKAKRKYKTRVLPVYDWYKGDEWMGMGTVKEMAERFGIKYESLHWMCTPSAHKVLKYESQWFKIPVDQEEEEE